MREPEELLLPAAAKLGGVTWWQAYKLIRRGQWAARRTVLHGRNTWLVTSSSVRRWRERQAQIDVLQRTTA